MLCFLELCQSDVHCDMMSAVRAYLLCVYLLCQSQKQRAIAVFEIPDKLYASFACNQHAGSGDFVG